MSTNPKVHIAGIGLSLGGSQRKISLSALISAATKALLDAGVTIEDVTKGIRSRSLEGGAKVFDAFEDEGLPTSDVKDGSEVNEAAKLVSQRGEQCVLVMAADKADAIGIVLVSSNFLMRWPYLKDSAIALGGSGGSGDGGLKGVCEAVWSLRGWSKNRDKGSSKVQWQGHDLSRSDGQDIPKWQDVKHRQDGRHRLGYNPAQDSREVYQEEFEAVKASSEEEQSKKGKKAGGPFERKGGDRAVLDRQQKSAAKL